MSGSSPEKLDLTASGQQPLPTSDSRLLDAAETLVTLHSRGAGSRSRSVAAQESSKAKTVYLAPHQQEEAYKMAPQPPTSANSMGPPPPPGPASNNVTFLLINQNSTSSNLMKPPMDPPPRRGRGRGRGRGSSVSSGESSRGRGGGRGRGAHKPPPTPPPVKWNEEMETSQDEADMNDVGEMKDVPKEDTTFMVGNLELKDSIFDDILNKKKLELLMDPEIVSVLNRQQKTLRNGGHRK